MAVGHWSHNQRKRIRELATDYTTKELASIYAVTYSVMYLYCKRHGIVALSEKPRWPLEVKTFILDNRELSCAELARVTGYPQDSIRHLLCSVYGPRWRKTMEKNRGATS